MISRFYKLCVIGILLLASFFFLGKSTKADATDEALKFLKGTWVSCGQSGSVKFVFTKKYLKSYGLVMPHMIGVYSPKRKGNFIGKRKIVSTYKEKGNWTIVVGDNPNNYTYYKYRNNNFECWWKESGEWQYSGTSSICRPENYDDVFWNYYYKKPKIKKQRSEKYQKKNTRKILKYFKKNRIKKAKKINKRLPKYAYEKCVDKMGFKRKFKYCIKVAKIKRIYDYYYTDLNNDKKADLLIVTKNGGRNYYLKYFTYKKGKVKYMSKMRIGNIYAGHCYFSAYPKHKGIIQEFGHMGNNSVSIIKYSKGKLREKIINDRESNTYLNMRGMLLSQMGL